MCAFLHNNGSLFRIFVFLLVRWTSCYKNRVMLLLHRVCVCMCVYVCVCDVVYMHHDVYFVNALIAGILP